MIASATAAASVIMWPASVIRASECASSPATNSPTMNATISASAPASQRRSACAAAARPAEPCPCPCRSLIGPAFHGAPAFYGALGPRSAAERVLRSSSASPAAVEGATLRVTGGGLHADRRAFGELGQCGGPRVRTGRTHSGGDVVEQVLHAGTLRVQVLPPRGDALLE